MSTNLEHQVNLIVTTIIECSRFMLRDFNEILLLQSSKKGVNDFAAKCITRLKNRITETLSEKRPRYAIIGPGEPIPDSEFFFVIEPLAGTNNFKHGIPFFCTAIGLYSKQQENALAIVINNPILREVFYAGHGLGSWGENYNESLTPKYRLRVSPLSRSDEKFTFNFGNPLLEIAYLAAGRLDNVTGNGDSPILRATSILVREAGGKISFEDKKFQASNSLT